MHQKEIKDNKEKDVKIDNKGIYLILILENTTWLRRWQWHSTPVLLPEKSHGRRSLVGCSPWCR